MFDLIVVGSGAAGLSAALRGADLGARVGVLTAGQLLAGSSPRAQGGVAAAVGADDAPALHAADTMAVGAGLNDASAVDVLTREGSRWMQQLWDDGMPFEEDLGLEAGHARRRILHAGGGATGQVLTSALLARAAAHQLITLFENSPVTSLESASGRVSGAYVGQRLFSARAVVIATGGYAALWGRSTNAPESRGAGLVLAWRAGASLADLEFVQFHPTALSVPGRPAFLLSEALRGEGALLLDAAGNSVVDPLLARDVVARALHRHLRSGRGQVFLSLQHLDAAHVYSRFAGLAASVRDFGLDLARDRLPVAPAAHYCMGGVRTDTWGRTDVPGLYAAGEVACSGVQGANRLASNSLLECIVFGARAAETALSDAPATAATWPTQDRRDSSDWTKPACREQANTERARIELSDGAKIKAGAGANAAERFEAVAPEILGAWLNDDLGVERDPRRLAQLIAQLPQPEVTPAADLALAALIVRAAVLRTESRGAHFRIDAPDPDPVWRGRIVWRRGHLPAFEEVPSA